MPPLKIVTAPDPRPNRAAEPVAESEVFPEGFEDVIGRRISMPEVVVKS